jgi:hypothetical protein
MLIIYRNRCNCGSTNIFISQSASILQGTTVATVLRVVASRVSQSPSSLRVSAHRLMRNRVLMTPQLVRPGEAFPSRAVGKIALVRSGMLFDVRPKERKLKRL